MPRHTFDHYVLESRVGGTTAFGGNTNIFETLFAVDEYLRQLYPAHAHRVMTDLRARQYAYACLPPHDKRSFAVEMLWTLRKEHVAYDIVGRTLKNLQVFTYDNELVDWKLNT